MKLFYLCHPVGGDVPGNIARALRWLSFLRKHERDVVITAPWIPAILAGEDDADPAQRDRGLRDCVATVARFDGVILCGGRVSAGMQAERAQAEVNGLEVHDLTWMGDEPPAVWPPPGRTWGQTVARMERVL